MPRTIARLFDNLSDAEHAVTALENAGVPSEDISVVRHKPGEKPARLYGEHDSPAEAAAKDAGLGAAIGGAVGGAGGVLGGVALLAMPGLGPVVAAGWLAAAIGAALTGAVAGAAGGLVVALTNSGVHRDEAELLAEGVRRGGVLVSAKVADDLFDAADAAIGKFDHVDLAARGAAYRAEGWSATDDEIDRAS
jgi:hypothetical protein